MHQLARLSIGRLRTPDDERFATDFAEVIELVTAATAGAAGFVWHNDAEPARNPRSFAALTVWRSQEHLRSFLTGPVHRAFMMRRDEWFEVHDGPHEVLFWTCSMRNPTLGDAIQRLQTLRTSGPTLHAFTINDRIPPN